MSCWGIYVLSFNIYIFFEIQIIQLFKFISILGMNISKYSEFIWGLLWMFILKTRNYVCSETCLLWNSKQNFIERGGSERNFNTNTCSPLSSLLPYFMWIYLQIIFILNFKMEQMFVILEASVYGHMHTVCVYSHVCAYIFFVVSPYLLTHTHIYSIYKIHIFILYKICLYTFCSIS